MSWLWLSKTLFCWYFSAKVSAISSSTSTKTLSPSRLLLSARCTGSSSRTQRPTDGWPLRSRGPTCFIQFLEIFLLWGNLDVWFGFFDQRISVWRKWRVVGMLEKRDIVCIILTAWNWSHSNKMKNYHFFYNRCLVRVIEKVKGVITRQRAFDVALLDSFASASLQELDYLNEAANQVFLSIYVFSSKDWENVEKELIKSIITKMYWKGGNGKKKCKETCK